jgi:hypothetical protein
MNKKAIRTFLTDRETGEFGMVTYSHGEDLDHFAELKLSDGINIVNFSFPVGVYLGDSTDKRTVNESIHKADRLIEMINSIRDELKKL